MKILSLSGFIPEQICDTVRFTGYSGDTAISHYCQYTADFISQVLHDNSIDGAVFPKSCDSTRNIKSYLDNTDKFIYQLPIPSSQDECAISYFAKEIKAYQKAIESYYGIEISDVKERIEAVNKRNNAIKLLYDNLENISYSDYLINIHKMLVKPLREQIFEDTIPPKPAAGGGAKRVYITGSFLTSYALLEGLENFGLHVVGDNLPESGRLADKTPCKIEGDLYKNIAQNILSARLSPTQNNFERLIADDLKEIKEKQVSGVIFITQKYCEAYDYLYSVYEKKLQSQGIKSLKISLTNSESYKKSELALEAFSDMI